MADAGTQAALLVGQGLLTQQSLKIAKQGMNQELDQIKLRQQQERLAAADTTYQQSRQLVSALATQQSMAAASNMGLGSIMGAQNESLADFQDDAALNDLNYRGKKNQLDFQAVDARQKYRATKIEAISSLLSQAAQQGKTYSDSKAKKEASEKESVKAGSPKGKSAYSDKVNLNRGK